MIKKTKIQINKANFHITLLTRSQAVARIADPTVRPTASQQQGRI